MSFKGLSKLFTSKTGFEVYLFYSKDFILHFSARKNSNEELKKALEGVVVPMFCNAATSNATEEQKAKLTKVFSFINTMNTLKEIFQ